MPNRSHLNDSESLRAELVKILTEFEDFLGNNDLRQKVLKLVPAYHKLRELGVSLLPVSTSQSAARKRILRYFQKYPGVVIDSDELLVVSGIQEYARRIRELRVEQGWPIISGVTASALAEEGELDERFEGLSPRHYVLLKNEQDRDAAYRWKKANEIRKQKGGAKKRLLTFFRANVGFPVSGEELAYVAKDAKNWQRRIRELRTEEGWPIFTRMTGGDDLPQGSYVLRENRQSQAHDRHIPDTIRTKVLVRDDFSCRKCQWKVADRREGDPRRFLELHHIKPHIKKGENTEENLICLCNVHHDEIHRLDKGQNWGKIELHNWLNLK